MIDCATCYGIGQTQAIDGTGFASDPVECERCDGSGRVWAPDLSNEVQRWAASWAHYLNRAEGVSFGRVYDRKGLETDYQRNPDELLKYIASGVPVLPLVPESWATRALQAAGIALIYVPDRRMTVGWEVRSGVWAVLSCQLA